MANSSPKLSQSLLCVLDSINKDRNFIQFILASKSPRRVEIVKHMGLHNVIVLPSSFEENLKKSDFAQACQYAEQTARLKGENVIRQYFKESALHSNSSAGSPELSSTSKREHIFNTSTPEQLSELTESTKRCQTDVTLNETLKLFEYNIIIAADTIVEINGQIYEKPKSKEEARAMLKSFSGTYHTVHTGVALFLLTKNFDIQSTRVFSNSTKVYFRSLHPLDIETYINSEEPYDKAGGYGLQANGAHFIPKIDGCFYNVMGLPLEALSVQLADMITMLPVS